MRRGFVGGERTTPVSGEPMTFTTRLDQYNVNVKEIDVQHRQLASLANELRLAVQSHRSPDELDKLMKQFIDLTREHFATEESLMLEYDYPGYPIHKAQHDELLRQLVAFAEEVSGMSHAAFRFDFDVSSDWLMHHISESDQKLGNFLNNKNVF
jgi:hemerythrin-like metal-binding protein